jgi:hypothetical protein
MNWEDDVLEESEWDLILQTEKEAMAAKKKDAVLVICHGKYYYACMETLSDEEKEWLFEERLDIFDEPDDDEVRAHISKSHFIAVKSNALPSSIVCIQFVVFT